MLKTASKKIKIWLRSSMGERSALDREDHREPNFNSMDLSQFLFFFDETFTIQEQITWSFIKTYFYAKPVFCKKTGLENRLKNRFSNRFLENRFFAYDSPPGLVKG